MTRLQLNASALLIVSVFLCSIVLLGYAMADSNQIGFTSNVSDEQAFTNFTLTNDVDGAFNTKLRVPTAYLDKEENDPGDAGAYLRLKMLWPSLASTSVRFGTINQEQYDEQEKLLRSGEAFKIQFFQGRVAHMSQNIQNLIKNDWDLMPNPTPIPGFTEYISKIDEKNEVPKKHWLGSVFLVPTDPNYSQKIYIQCPINAPPPVTSLYCEENTYLGRYVYGQYMFSLANLQEWKKIDAAVQKLFTDMHESALQASSPP